MVCEYLINIQDETEHKDAIACGVGEKCGVSTPHDCLKKKIKYHITPHCWRIAECVELKVLKDSPLSGLAGQKVRISEALKVLPSRFIRIRRKQKEKKL